ncbi:MAG TPA: GIY-YIG nuclease family protein [Candidatus Paceibacterota bacterium]|jgi:putative endonuclease
MSYVVYIVECNDGTYYTGYTNNIQKRLEEHNSGNGARYTSGRYPVLLMYSETCDSQGAALRREWEIKKLSRRKKEMLIKKGNKARKSS